MASVPTLGSGSNDSAPWRGLGKKHAVPGARMGSLAAPNIPWTSSNIPQHPPPSPQNLQQHPNIPQHPPNTSQRPTASSSILPTCLRLLSKGRAEARQGLGQERSRLRSSLSAHISSEEGALGAQVLQPGVLQGATAIFSFISWPLHKGQVLSRSCLKTTAEFTGAR